MADLRCRASALAACLIFTACSISASAEAGVETSAALGQAIAAGADTAVGKMPVYEEVPCDPAKPVLAKAPRRVRRHHPVKRHHAVRRPAVKRLVAKPVRHVKAAAVHHRPRRVLPVAAKAASVQPTRCEVLRSVPIYKASLIGPGEELLKIADAEPFASGARPAFAPNSVGGLGGQPFSTACGSALGGPSDCQGLAGGGTPTTTPVSPAPEPSTWQLLIGGVGLLGVTLRVQRRRRLVVAA